MCALAHKTVHQIRPRCLVPSRKDHGGIIAVIQAVSRYKDQRRAIKMQDKDLQQVSTSKRSAVKESALLFGIKGEEKIEAFEKMLSELLKFSDTIPEAMSKMVKAALACEFGSSILDDKKSAIMVKSISGSILADGELRRQALLVIDRFAKADELNA